MKAFTRALTTEDIESAESATDDEIRRKSIVTVSSRMHITQSHHYHQCKITRIFNIRLQLMKTNK